MMAATFLTLSESAFRKSPSKKATPAKDPGESIRLAGKYLTSRLCDRRDTFFSETK